MYQKRQGLVLAGKNYVDENRTLTKPINSEFYIAQLSQAAYIAYQGVNHIQRNSKLNMSNPERIIIDKGNAFKKELTLLLLLTH